MMRKIISAATFMTMFLLQGKAQPVSSAQIDSLTNLVLKTFDVPGIAVAVVKDGKILHA